MPDSAFDSLLHIINQAMLTKSIPEEWKHSRIYPIYKGSGNIFDMNNYRPIALLSVPYKIYTAIINTRLSKVLEARGILVPEQTGFRSNMDTSLNLSVINNVVKDSMEYERKLHAIFIDLSKAYDSVQFWAIEQNLKYIGFDEETIQLIISLYDQNTADIITGVGVTSSFNVTAGVRQGDPLSPTIFLIVINALLQYLKDHYKGYRIRGVNVTSLGYADDIVLLSEDGTEIGEMFEVIKQWCAYNSMNINPKKSAYAWNNDAKTQQDLVVNDFPIEHLHNKGYYKYLGHYINLTGCLDMQMEQTVQRYKKLVTNICNKKYLGNKLKVMLINAVAQATVTYQLDTVVFPTDWIRNLDQWTVETLQYTGNIRTQANKNIWWQVMGLNKLEHLSPARFISTFITRVLN